jgi:hypothetical protein
MTHDPKTVVEEFCTLCERVALDYDLYCSLFEIDQRILDLFSSIAPMCFKDLNEILVGHLVVQFSKITDPAKSTGQYNLTSNYILSEIQWPTDVHQKLQDTNERLMAFRKKIKPARNKRSAHFDLVAQTEQQGDLGSFPKGEDEQFIRNLDTFASTAYEHTHDGNPTSIRRGMSTDTHELIKALESSILYNRCSKCSDGERAIAALDMRISLRTKPTLL